MTKLATLGPESADYGRTCSGMAELRDISTEFGPSSTHSVRCRRTQHGLRRHAGRRNDVTPERRSSNAASAGGKLGGRKAPQYERRADAPRSHLWVRVGRRVGSPRGLTKKLSADALLPMTALFGDSARRRKIVVATRWAPIPLNSDHPHRSVWSALMCVYAGAWSGSLKTRSCRSWLRLG